MENGIPTGEILGKEGGELGIEDAELEELEEGWSQKNGDDRGPE